MTYKPKLQYWDIAQVTVSKIYGARSNLYRRQALEEAYLAISKAETRIRFSSEGGLNLKEAIGELLNHVTESARETGGLIVLLNAINEHLHYLGTRERTELERWEAVEDAIGKGKLDLSATGYVRLWSAVRAHQLSLVARAITADTGGK
ncbi:MAG: hypothetical protein GY896_22715 [Gammaproteobacteria bacterium]|nr:hypothetical protein [Gammaproteobacteria bacterium]